MRLKNLEITINAQDLKEKGDDFIIAQKEVKVDLSPKTNSNYFGRFVSKNFATDAVNKKMFKFYKSLIINKLRNKL